jgi:hypothetical protein
MNGDAASSYTGDEPFKLFVTTTASAAEGQSARFVFRPGVCLAVEAHGKLSFQVSELRAEGHDVRGRASANTLSRRYGERPASVTTSTARCKRSSRSCLIAMGSNRLRPGSSVTSRSRSLSGRASPLALDPKMRTDWAPCDRETRKISKTGSRSGFTPQGHDRTLWPPTYLPQACSSRRSPGRRQTSRRPARRRRHPEVVPLWARVCKLVSRKCAFV